MRGPVPLGSVLLGEQDEAAVVGHPGRAPGVGEQDQGEQPGDARVVGQQRAEHPGQVDGPLHEVAPDEGVADRGGVARGEDEVDDLEHGVDAGRQLGGGGHPVGDAGPGDLLLGPGDPRRHGRLTDQEGPGHLGGAQAAHQAERQGHLRGQRQRRVAAGEDEPQPVVADLVGLVLARPRGRASVDEQRPRPAQRGLPAEKVEGVAAGDGGQPGSRPGRHPGAGPDRQGLGVGVLHALLGQVEIGGHPRRRRDHEGPLVAVGLSDGGDDRGVRDHQLRQSKTRIGRTSTPPARVGISLARASASSRSAASTR